MINSTSSSDRTPYAGSEKITRPKVVIRYPDNCDQLSPENSASLRVALTRTPEIRPEVVVRGRALAADPSYPSAEILRRVAEAIMRSPDYSEDAS